MTELPKTLEHAIAQSQQATQAALDDGFFRLQVELLFPELRVMDLFRQFMQPFEVLEADLRIFFPDAGAAALARRDWGEKPFPMRGMKDLNAQIQDNEKLFLFVEPSSVEVSQVESLCNDAGDRPVVLFLPRMEDVATIGIGYAGRQLRERFLNQFESCYYLRPIEGAAVLRCYPSPWQIWKELEDGEYELISEMPQKPSVETLEQLLQPETESQSSKPAMSPSVGGGFLGEMKRFLRALTQ
jgi:hypothetical protein